MKRILSAVAAAAVMASAGAAVAADLVIDTVAAEPAVAQGGAYATFFAGGSFASGDTTISGGGGGVTIESELDGGFIIGGALGMSVYENLRGEIEFSYIQANVASIGGVAPPPGFEATSTGYNLLGNLWYDFANDSGFTPYVGAGVGFGTTQVSSDGDEDISASGLLYQLGAGVKVDVADNIALDLGYRYRVLSDADTTMEGLVVPPGVDVTTDAVNHIVQAGVTFGF